MKIIGFIPLRTGSKGVPGKNKRKIAGKPLFTWILGAAYFSKLDEIVVYTDDDYIISFINNEYHYTSRIRVVKREPYTATDIASTESAMIAYAEKINYNFDVFCLLHATSPFTTSRDIDESLKKLKKGYDSTVSVVRAHRFIWAKEATPMNYDPFDRPRRQDFEGLLIENGAVYTCTRAILKEKKSRLGGKIGLVEMPEDTLLEINTNSDWIAVENLLIEQQKKRKGLDKITHIVLDVDGVFTDGSITYTKEGEHTKRFDIRDGMGLEIIKQFGIKLVVLTSEESSLVAKRMEKLKIDHIFLGVKDKHTKLLEFVQTYDLHLNNFAYMGDDVNDLANICSVGWSFAPNNAINIVKQHTDIILSNDSGNGAIREMCDFIFKYNKRFHTKQQEIGNLQQTIRNINNIQ